MTARWATSVGSVSFLCVCSPVRYQESQPEEEHLSIHRPDIAEAVRKPAAVEHGRWTSPSDSRVASHEAPAGSVPVERGGRL